MTKKQRAAQAVSLLKAQYPLAECSLRYEKPHELLVATRLSAQCTDARVNLVTPALFARFPTLEAFAAADEEEVETADKKLRILPHEGPGYRRLFQNVARRIQRRGPRHDRGARPPARRRAKDGQLIVGDVYHKPAVVCDTHCIRITNLLGLADSKDPLKAEKQLRAGLPMREASDFCHRLVLHGREVCRARKPQCSRCVMLDICLHSPDKKVARRNAK